MYDFSVRPDSSSSPGALKAFWNQVRLYATDQQKANLGPAPQFAESQHTQSEEYRGQSFAEFLRAEDARMAPERERQRLAAIANSEHVLAAKRRHAQRESAAHDAEVTKAAQAWFDKPAGERQPEFTHYAALRGIIDPRYGLETSEQIHKTMAELNERFWPKKKS
jgi:hypothetical protein